MNEKKEPQENYSKAYILAVLTITWLVTITLFIDPYTGINFFSIIMLIPGLLAIVFVKLLHKDPKMKLAGLTKKISSMSLLFGILYPILFLLLCALIAQITGIGKLDSQKIVTIEGIMTFIITIVVTLFGVLGEEYGWRGYLLPELTKMKGKTKSTIIVGMVWALYHVPVVYLLARTTGSSNPLLLCLIQAAVIFTLSFPISYCFYLSGSILPVLLFHSIWNILNTTILGDIYRKEYGIIEGNLLYINGEGFVGLILGTCLIYLFIRQFKKDESSSR
jgi:uncharacterized protein